MPLKLLIKISLVLLLNHGCAAQKNPLKSGVLTGTTGVFEGNCMPSPGQPPCQPTPLSTTIYITQPSDVFSMKLLVDSTISSFEGKYKLSLAVGDYSLFVRDEQKIVCRDIRCSGPCICTPFTISADSTTYLDPTLDRAAW